MTKIYDLIPLNDHLYMVDKKTDTRKELKSGDYYDSHLSEIMQTDGTSHGLWSFPLHKILASTDKSLNLPLLPAIEEDVEILAMVFYPPVKQVITDCDLEKQISKRIGFAEGYKAAKAKRYSEEDMKKAMLFAWTSGLDKRDHASDWYIQSLNPLPKRVEVECNTYPIDANGNVIGTGMSYPYTGLLANFTIKFVPVVENNIIKVVKWIYE